MAVPPLVLAKLGDPGWFYAFATAGLVAALAVGVWLPLRRRSRALGRVALALGALLVVGSFVPPPTHVDSRQVEGVLTGRAMLDVLTDPGAPLVVENGTGRLEADGTRLVLECPQRCAFRLGAPASPEPGPDAWLPGEDDPLVTLEGGPFLLTSNGSVCSRLPYVVAWSSKGEPCGVCSRTRWLAGEGSAEPQRMTRTEASTC